MSKSIRLIGNCSINGLGFRLYENEDGSATVRQEYHSREYPNQMWKKFSSVKSAERHINDIAGEDVFGSDRVWALIQAGWGKSEEELERDAEREFEETVKNGWY